MTRATRIAASALALVACGSSSDAYRAGATMRASASLNCPEGLVSVRSTGAGGYIASGCGRVQSYTCVSDSRGRGFGAHREAVCAPDGPAETAGSAGGGSRDDTRYSTSSLEDARVALAAIASCPPVEHEATIAITIGADGTATRTETPGVPVTTGTCVVTALRSAVFPTRRTTEVARVRLDPHPATTAAVVTRPAADPAAEASARHAIDDLRTAILACSSGAAIAVTGEWTTSGALTLHLSGALAGTPEEGCVRAAASGVVLSPVPTASGSVLQAVR